MPAQTLIGATALLHVPNAPEAKPETYSVSAKSGDWLVITGLNNYRSNDVSIDPSSIPPNVLMPIYRRRLVPADDAILSVEFETMKGWQFVAELRNGDDEKLPFGAVARLLAEQSISTMDTVLNERSRAYFGAAPETGVIEVIWSEKDEKRVCWAPYSLKKAIAAHPDARVIRETLVCHFSPADNHRRPAVDEAPQNAEPTSKLDATPHELPTVQRPEDDAPWFAIYL